jgi:hypothetical protein
MSHPLGRVALGLDYALPPKTVSMTDAALAKFAGTYVLPSGAKLKITAGGGGLNAASEDQESYGLLHGARGDSGARLNEKVTQMLEAASHGDFAAIAKNFPAARRPMVEARQRDMWAQHAANYGPFRKSQVLGTGADGPGMATQARLDFERGTVFVRYLWSPEGEMMGMLIMDLAPATHYAPESEGGFVSFSLPGPQIQRLKFQMDASGAPAGLMLGEAVAKKM